MTWLNTLISVLSGKKTVTKFEVGGFDVRIAILPGVNDLRGIRKEYIDEALKEAMQNVLSELVAKNHTPKG